MSNCYTLLGLSSLLFIFSSSLLATSIISTAPGGTPSSGYQGETTPSLETNDIIRGHVMFKGGLKVNTSPVTWDGDGILNGALLQGTSADKILSLKSDLKLGSTATFGNSSTATTVFSGDNSVVLGGDIILQVSAQIKLINNPIIDGKGHTLFCSNFSYFIQSGTNPSLSLKNITIKGASSADTQGMFATDGSINQIVFFENTTLIPTRTLSSYTTLFSTADGYATTVTINGRVSIEGFERRVKLKKATNLTITIKKNSTLYIGKGVIFEVMDSSSDNYSITFVMEDRTSVLHLDGCDFYTGSNGLTLTKGTVIFDDKVRIFNKNYGGATNTDMSKALTFGDGTAAGDVDVIIRSGAYVMVDGCLKYNHS